jgi:hypothetical protein
MAAVPVDPRAATGFANAADAYERGRPGYPDAAVAELLAAFGVRPGGAVLDLAAGTGKLTGIRELVGADHGSNSRTGPRSTVRASREAGRREPLGSAPA